MTLPTGLVPVFAFVLTVGVATPVAVGAHLFYRARGSSFRSALRVAVLGVGGLYLVGVAVVWAIAGGVAVWEVAAALLLAGLSALLVWTILPLILGQQLVQRAGDADSETALRYATYGWPITMLVAFAIFVAPGGLAHGTLFALGGARTCLAGHCGIAVSFAAAVVFEAVVAVLGPGVVGLAIYSSTVAARGRQTSP